MPASAPTVLATSIGFDSRGRGPTDWAPGPVFDLAVDLAGAPAQPPPVGRLRKPVCLDAGLYVCGDHRDSGSIQGALVSGRRAARAVLTDLGAA